MPFPHDGHHDPAKQKLWRSFTLLWAVVIFVTSSTVIGSKAFVHSVANVAPGALSEHAFSGFWSSWWWLFVKGYHVLEFAVLAFLLCRWLASKPLWLPVALSAVYAASDEIHQLWVPERGARVTDWLIDMIGISAVGVYVWLARRQNQGRMSNG